MGQISNTSMGAYDPGRVFRCPGTYATAATAPYLIAKPRVDTPGTG